MDLKKDIILFVIGGGSYVGVELLFRGYSHSTMFFLGGLCFLLIGYLGRLKHRPSLPVQAMLGSGIATAGELIFGLIFNQDYTIWDYRDQAGNFLGQICPTFSLLWIPLCFLAILVFDWCDKKLTHVYQAVQRRRQPS